MEICEFKNHLLKYLSDEQITLLIDSINKGDPFDSILIDDTKISLEKILELYPFLKPHPVVKNVFLFDKNKYPLGKSLLFEIGAFYIFEPCSSLVNYFLNPSEDDFVLDMAAAPGGKSIHCSLMMKNQGQIIANEINPSRALILASNVEKYGRRNIIVTNQDCTSLHKYYKETFSKIILDAPCSGSGMFRKSSKMQEDWTYNKVLSLAKIQKELIILAYEMLKPGGELVYSTCSFSFEEDEEVIQNLLNNTDAELVNLPHIDGEFRSSMSETIHLLPFLFEGEGHFIAKIRKPGTINKSFINEVKRNKAIPDYLTSLGQIYLSSKNELLLTNHLVLSHLHIIKIGVKIGILDKKLGIIYDHNLSRSDIDLLPIIPTTEKETKDYIYGLTLNRKLPDQYYFLEYNGIKYAIGKLSHNTIKNHYPKGLRKKL